MFRRLIRAIRSLFGGLVGAMEDPALILEQNIRELNEQIPQMNENIATVKANVILLEKEIARFEKQVADLENKIRSAIQLNRDDIAEGYALQLDKVTDSLAHSKEQLGMARQAYEKALKVKEVFMREKDRKISEAREALRAHERAKWQAKVADTLEQFEMAGPDQTHDEMVNRIREKTAVNEARMEMALGSVDTDVMEVEANAEKLRAQALVDRFRREMSGEPEPATEPATAPEQKAPAEAAPAQEESGDAEPPEQPATKTVGRTSAGPSKSGG